MIIKDMAIDERPREKGIKYGVEYLSNRELLAIIVRNGLKGRTALDISDDILRMSKGISGLPNLKLDDLCKIRGISKVKGLEILVCFELVKRVLKEMCEKEVVINSPGFLYDYLKLELGNSDQEKMMVILLDNALHVKKMKTIFMGTIDRTHIYPRDIVRVCLENHSNKIILVHNHPSNNVSASKEDISITQVIKESCELMNIDVLDHLIVSRNNYFSFKENGLL